jgi:hypothetical protein
MGGGSLCNSHAFAGREEALGKRIAHLARPEYDVQLSRLHQSDSLTVMTAAGHAVNACTRENARPELSRAFVFYSGRRSAS